PSLSVPFSISRSTIRTGNPCEPRPPRSARQRRDNLRIHLLPNAPGRIASSGGFFLVCRRSRKVISSTTAIPFVPKSGTKSVSARITLPELQAKAKSIRRHIITSTTAAASGHPTSSLSGADIATALYFGGVLRYDPKNPHWPARDKFILSKG